MPLNHQCNEESSSCVEQWISITTYNNHPVSVFWDYQQLVTPTLTKNPIPNSIQFHPILPFGFGSIFRFFLSHLIWPKKGKPKMPIHIPKPAAPSQSSRLLTFGPKRLSQTNAALRQRFVKRPRDGDLVVLLAIPIWRIIPILLLHVADHKFPSHPPVPKHGEMWQITGIVLGFNDLIFKRYSVYIYIYIYYHKLYSYIVICISCSCMYIYIYIIYILFVCIYSI